MARNQRKCGNSIAIKALSKWIIVAFFLGIAGLSYVYFKNQMHTAGKQIRDLEGELSEIRMQNEVVRAKISSLSSRAVLQRRLNEGFIKMVPIADQHIARFRSRPSGLASVELHAASIKGVSR